MEDYEYLWVLNQSADKLRHTDPKSALLARADKLLDDRRVISGPDPLTEGNWALLDDGAAMLKVRHEIGELCDQINASQRAR
jgi:hypothetical protein